MRTIQKAALIITIIGAINWGLIGFFEFNLVDSLFSSNNSICRIVYALVGLCGLINCGLLFTRIDYDK